MAVRVLPDHTDVNTATPLFGDSNGTQVQKIKMSKAWVQTVNEEVTGHSARRSGAMWYTRKGMPVHEIGLLGRWKSSAVFRYTEETLQEIPLNATVTGEKETEKCCYVRQIQACPGDTCVPRP